MRVIIRPIQSIQSIHKTRVVAAVAAHYADFDHPDISLFPNTQSHPVQSSPNPNLNLPANPAYNSQFTRPRSHLTTIQRYSNTACQSDSGVRSQESASRSQPAHPHERQPPSLSRLPRGFGADLGAQHRRKGRGRVRLTLPILSACARLVCGFGRRWWANPTHDSRLTTYESRLTTHNSLDLF